MKHLELSRGLRALVDDEDHERLSGYRWFANVKLRTAYAYRTVSLDGKNKNTLLHREIMCAPPGLDVDHINGDGLDNRRENLRICTRAENMRNQTHKAANKSSQFKGVSWAKQKRKWLAGIRLNERHVFLGYFDREEDARDAYAAAAREAFGDFAAPIVERKR